MRDLGTEIEFTWWQDNWDYADGGILLGSSLLSIQINSLLARMKISTTLSVLREGLASWEELQGDPEISETISRLNGNLAELTPIGALTCAKLTSPTENNLPPTFISYVSPRSGSC